ncbi:non-ribosomal peptide synthetase [Streptomyces sp. NBC_01478]|uniref:non-ribosomal peptide synthetase n=1 Tax=Streptomyces sp. NBC_01478 TaxID=2903882 RepID=UPI002E328D1E|nr:non-ribosomal peptide synthetase [Streptomyces sp. NBC_01478]
MTTSLQLDVLPGRPVSERIRGDEPEALGNGPALPRAEPAPVHELVARFARVTPTATAVSSGDSAIGYRALDAWADRIADRLARAGVRRGSRVGVLVGPSTAMVATVLGVLRAKAAYVPVEPAHPDRRIADVLADARVGAVVVDRAGADRVSGLCLPLIVVEETESGTTTAATADADADTDDDDPLTGDDPAYLIYTSGSTGEPKGVEVGHRELAASTLARRTVYPGRPTFLLVSPLAFDSSVAGLWGTLTAGGHLVVAGPDEVRDPERLSRLVERHGVTRLLCVPSLYSVLLDAAERYGTERLRTLETVITAGEPLPTELMHRHFALHGRPVALVNEYGPTEATVWASYRRYDAPGPVSIGGPVPGVRLYVLDERLRPVPRGAEGELYIGGAGVSRGYFGRPDATAHAFLDDPFTPIPGARMYRTGDLVRWTAEGTLGFLGRRDHQVKIHGHRIELGAVEAALGALTGVREAVVVPDPAGTALTGFALMPSPVTGQDLRERLARVLPAAMVPARIEVLDAFPRTVNGKADRAALRDSARPPHPTPEPTAVRPTGTDTSTDPTEAIRAAWAEVLQTQTQPQTIPVDVNFFDLGGHSLAMFRLQDALERHTGSRPPIVALFRHTTVAAQAELIRGGGTQAHDTEAEARRTAARRARALRARRHTHQDQPK